MNLEDCLKSLNSLISLICLLGLWLFHLYAQTSSLSLATLNFPKTSFENYDVSYSELKAGIVGLVGMILGFKLHFPATTANHANAATESFSTKMR